MSRLLALAGCVLLAALPLPAPAALDVDATVFTERSLGLTLHIPEGWTPSTQTGYPGLLLLLQAPAPAGRSRIVLAGGETPAGKTLDQVVAESLTGLRAVGLVVVRNQRGAIQGRTVWEITARGKRDVEVRQLYLMQGRRAFSLTLAGPAAEVARLQAELNQVASGLRLE